MLFLGQYFLFFRMAHFFCCEYIIFCSTGKWSKLLTEALLPKPSVPFERALNTGVPEKQH
jgi:hypothetical protein